MTTKTFLEEHRGQKQGANKGTRNAAEKNRQVGIRKRSAKAAVEAVRTASRGVTLPQGVWLLNHRSHAALRHEVEYLYAVDAAEARLAAALDDAASRVPRRPRLGVPLGPCRPRRT